MSFPYLEALNPVFLNENEFTITMEHGMPNRLIVEMVVDAFLYTLEKYKNIIRTRV
jgi:hypothetical protein